MIVNRESLIPLLKEIAQLLERNGNPGHAEFVSALVTVAHWAVTAVDPGLTSGAMWGGSGSVFDVASFNSRDDRRRFMQLLVRLVEEMRKTGINAPNAEDRATIMESCSKRASYRAGEARYGSLLVAPASLDAANPIIFRASFLTTDH